MFLNIIIFNKELWWRLIFHDSEMGNVDWTPVGFGYVSLQ